jgi:hypothetical protein
MTVNTAQVNFASYTPGGIFGYTDTPQTGSLFFSVSPVGGVDNFGNTFPGGIQALQGSLAGMTIQNSSLDASSTLNGSTLNNGQVVQPAIQGGTATSTLHVLNATGGAVYSYTSNSTTATFTGSGLWTCPTGITQVQVQCWAAGAGGDGGTTSQGGPGAGGGEYAAEPALAVIPGTVYNVTVGGGGIGGTTGNPGSNGGDTIFGSNQVFANGGDASPDGFTGGLGGAGSVNSVVFPGGNGANASGGGGASGGGSSAGTAATGNNGTAGSGSSGGAGGSAPTGGAAGGAGGASAGNGTNGSAPGGAGGGAGQGSGSGGQNITYYPTSTNSYYGAGVGGGQRNHNGSMFQGDPNVNVNTYPGDQESFANYNSTQMQSDWSGYTITSVTLTVTNQHSWYNSGCYCILGFVSTGNTYNATNFWTPQGQTTTHNVTSTLGGQIGSFTAIIFGPSSSTSGGSYDLYNYGYYVGGTSGPSITVTGTIGVGSTTAGNGANGQVKITYTTSTTLSASLSPVATTDAVSNTTIPVGFMGQIAAVDPVASAPATPAQWYTFNTIPTGWTNAGRAKYRLTAQNEVQLSVFHLQNGTSPTFNSADGLIIATLPVGFRPVGTHEFPIAADVLAVATGSNDKGAKWALGSNGQLTCWNLTTANQFYMALEVKIPLDL